MKFYERIDPFFVALAFTVVLFATAIVYSIKSAKEECPKFEYTQDAEVTSKNNKTFFLQKGYVLDVGHSYDILRTEQGYDIVFHFVDDAQ